MLFCPGHCRNPKVCSPSPPQDLLQRWSSSDPSPQSSAPSHTHNLEMQRWLLHSNFTGKQNLSWEKKSGVCHHWRTKQTLAPPLHWNRTVQSPGNQSKKHNFCRKIKQGRAFEESTSGEPMACSEAWHRRSTYYSVFHPRRFHSRSPYHTSRSWGCIFHLGRWSSWQGTLIFSQYLERTWEREKEGQRNYYCFCCYFIAYSPRIQLRVGNYNL